MKRIGAFLAAASTSLVLATTLLAQSAFPVRTVKIIVPFPGGGINDVLARILADNLAIKWSQPVVIENKTGAELAYQAEPDGYYGCARKCLESLSPCA